MSKRNFKTDRIEITEFAFNKIMSWAFSEEETIWICALSGSVVVDAFRLTNISSAPRNYFDYSKKELLVAKNKIRTIGCEPVIFGHSHSSVHHQLRPSRQDWLGLPKNSIQMIAFPHIMTLKIWTFKKCYKKTLKSECGIKIVN